MIEMDRRQLVIMMEAGYIYLGMQRFEEAYKVFDGVAALAPDSEVPLVALGGVDFCLGKFDDAIKWYKRALKIDPESIFAKVYTGEALFFAGKKEEALKILNDVAKADSKGGAGDFARALLDAIKQGFTPKMLAGAKISKGGS